MNWLRKVTLYTLLLFAAGVAAGFVFSIIGRIIGLEHRWGGLDAIALIRLVITLVVALGVFVTLARKHPAEYYSIGAGVALFTSILSTASAYYLAPLVAREAFNWLAAVAWPLVFNIIALAVAGQAVRLRRSSSNKSLERTREG